LLNCRQSFFLCCFFIHRIWLSKQQWKWIVCKGQRRLVSVLNAPPEALAPRPHHPL
jgi:hypothetical protein